MSYLLESFMDLRFVKQLDESGLVSRSVSERFVGVCGDSQLSIFVYSQRACSWSHKTA